MKFGDYIASKAVSLCGLGIAAAAWGVFAYLVGASSVLLWTSEAFFVVAVVLKFSLGYVLAKKRVEALRKTADGLTDKYLLGELVKKPHDAVESEYYAVMKTVSRAAVGEVERVAAEKEQYFEYVERWIHEIKTPLTACSLICDNGGDAVKIKRELKRADNLTETVLYYARLKNPEKDTVISKVAVADVIAEAVKSQRELLVAAKIGVEACGDFYVCTDGKSVCFMIKQLLVNCAKYCRGAHVVITAENGVISVSDDGDGIAAHELPRITERGFTGENGRRAGSTGMGLYIVSEMCKRLGIDLVVTSEKGKGTTFSLKFGTAVPASE